MSSTQATVSVLADNIVKYITCNVFNSSHCKCTSLTIILCLCSVHLKMNTKHQQCHVSVSS